MIYRVLDLFSGIGGFSLGLERTGGFETAAFCEIDPFCQRILAKHWPGVPIYEDVRGLSAKRLAADGIAVDGICGGFPCQPFSKASRGWKTATDLWPEMSRIITEVRPAFVVAENVGPAPIDRAASEMRALGYSTMVRSISAARAGADHTRNRWWLCAHTYDDSELSRSIDAEVGELPSIHRNLWGAENFARVVRVSDGLPDRVDRLKSLGNAVLPQIPEMIGRAILAADAERLAA